MITGLNRSGTTFLYQLMAKASGSWMAPAYYETEAHPVLTPGQPDARKEKAQAVLDVLTEFMPELLSMHELHLTEPHEDISIFMASMVPWQMSLIYDMPEWTEFLKSEKGQRARGAAFRMHKRWLQHLQNNRRVEHGNEFVEQRRWLLKYPFVTMELPHFLEVYPDATFIVCHRDPADVMLSWLQIIKAIHLNGNELAKEEVYNEVTVVGFDFIKWLMEGLLSFREEHRDMEDRFIDIAFVQFTADPLKVVRQIYSRLDKKMSDEEECQLKAAIEQKQREHVERKAKRNTVQWSDFGITRADVEKELAPYYTWLRSKELLA
ncbi:unnamed protein product [Chrysoparadoxa australica]